FANETKPPEPCDFRAPARKSRSQLLPLFALLLNPLERPTARRLHTQHMQPWVATRSVHPLRVSRTRGSPHEPCDFRAPARKSRSQLLALFALLLNPLGT